MQFHLFLPQMRLSFEKLIASARAAEAAGFGGIAGMDHLEPPNAETHPMYEAMITNTWLAAHTSTLKVGSLVLCDALRHPAVLAREAVSLDHASGGRFELAIGWGSWENDFARFGVGPAQPRERVARLRETLTRAEGAVGRRKGGLCGRIPPTRRRHPAAGAADQNPDHRRRRRAQDPGIGPRLCRLVQSRRAPSRQAGRQRPRRSARADWQRADFDSQEMVAYVPRGGDRAAITEAAARRFGHSRPVIGTGPELVEHFAKRATSGVERTYAWFCDFGQPETLAAFGEEVIAPLA